MSDGLDESWLHQARCLRERVHEAQREVHDVSLPRTRLESRQPSASSSFATSLPILTCPAFAATRRPDPLHPWQRRLLPSNPLHRLLRRADLLLPRRRPLPLRILPHPPLRRPRLLHRRLQRRLFRLPRRDPLRRGRVRQRCGQVHIVTLHAGDEERAVWEAVAGSGGGDDHWAFDGRDRGKEGA